MNLSVQGLLLRKITRFVNIEYVALWMLTFSLDFGHLSVYIHTLVLHQSICPLQRIGMNWFISVFFSTAKERDKLVILIFSSTPKDREEFSGVF